MSEETASDKNVEIWKVKKLIKSLQLARGNGTSMISLIIPPGDQVSSQDFTPHSVDLNNRTSPILNCRK
jgi:peptide subunit release factor 1 (eRF1)